MTETALARTTSAKAVAGFIFAFLIAPVGLGLSIAALRETRSGARGGYGLAVAGIVIAGLGTIVWVLYLIAFIALKR